MLKIFDIELSSPCNARCEFCPQKFHGVERRQPFMDEWLVDKIAAEIGEMARQERIHAILCGMGENLLRKPLVIRALDGLQRESAGRIHTLLVTNGARLTEDLLEHESFRKLEAIQVSFTGHGRESYEEIFGLKYDKVVENVTAMSRHMPGKVYIRAVDLGRLRPQRAQFESFWNEKGIPVSVRPLHSRGGHIQDPEAYPGHFRPFAGCEIFDWITFISSDGEVLSCCHDVTSQNVLGDCRTSTLAEIMAAKQALRRRGFEGFEICSRCTDFELSSLGRRAPGRAASPPAEPRHEDL
jgi:sulfatase maturation enzyme AslB (radical SAM superfamily)